MVRINDLFCALTKRSFYKEILPLLLIQNQELQKVHQEKEH
jgi:hypothetical protein